MIDMKTVKQNVDLREWAAHYITLRKNSSHDMHGPCPKCGSEHGLHVKADLFTCYGCRDKWGDLFEFEHWLNGCSFSEAVAKLTNAPLSVRQVIRTPPSTPLAEQREDWQRKAVILVERAHMRLYNDADREAEAGRNYLENERGLEPQTWMAFKLGFAPNVSIPGTGGKARAPAIVIPWYRGRKLIAVRYRFLKLQDGYKQTALSGSAFSGVLFGGQALETGIVKLSTLLVCEGEFNCCSSWQAARNTHLDVLSLGSESASITPAIVEHTNKYARLLCWLDKEARARAVAAALPGAHPIKSPNGQDANDLLQAGVLGGFLAKHRLHAARNRLEQERLLADLWDAAQLPGGLDEGTMLVLAEIKKTLGKM